MSPTATCEAGLVEMRPEVELAYVARVHACGEGEGMVWKERRGGPLRWLTGQSYRQETMVVARQRRATTSLEAKSLSICGGVFEAESVRVGGSDKFEAKSMVEKAARRS